MKPDPRACPRFFPFRSHRSWKEVIETEEAQEALRTLPKSDGLARAAWTRRLNARMARATLPSPMPWEESDGAA